VLPDQPLLTLDDYVAAGGGRGLAAAHHLGPDAAIEDILASGLRGRGGAGFPTGRKWSAVRRRGSSVTAATVVVNGAEGEPGSFKDRAILRANPFAVLEGALIAARCVGADRVVVAVRRSFTRELEILERAMVALRDGGWSDDVALELFAAPEEYLVGEETALLEVIAGRPPFPRLQAPFRHGVDEVLEHTDGEPEMAGEGGDTTAAPTLVQNVETMANVPGILAEGPAWFRAVGTDDSPGTVVCTVSGATTRAGVGEFAMGTPLHDVLDVLGGGMPDGRSVAAVMSGVANALVPGDRLDAPVSHEGMQAIGSGLGAAGFLVFDDQTDFAALAEGVSRFLSVESCGQCTPCKQDGRVITDLLHRIDSDEGERDPDDLVLLDLDAAIANVAESARCALAEQHQRVLGSIRELWGTHWVEHARNVRPPVAPIVIAPIGDLVDGRAVIETGHADKQPDWTYDEVDSGEAPADRYGEGRPHHYPPGVPARR